MDCGVALVEKSLLLFQNGVASASLRARTWWRALSAHLFGRCCSIALCSGPAPILTSGKTTYYN